MKDYLIIEQTTNEGLQTTNEGLKQTEGLL